jgi:motility quorum-sensing regulator/GCU-specific mRNA interferase toxin
METKSHPEPAHFVRFICVFSARTRGESSLSRNPFNDDGLTILPKKWQEGYHSSMEKRTPHCRLPVVKALVEAGKVRATHSARLGATMLGLELSDMLAIIKALTPADFYKSMTANADHRLWQDVYRPSTPVGDVYLKLTVIEDVLIVSFKEL